jgi:hypothetical protein
MTSIATQKHARRFFGAMGAAVRSTSRWIAVRQAARAEMVIRRVRLYHLEG